MRIQLIVGLIALTTLQGCAVAVVAAAVAASKKNGVTIDEAMKCPDRPCFLALKNVQVVSTEPAANGGVVEAYRIRLERRTKDAVMYGVLAKHRFATITTTYDANDRVISAMPSAAVQ